MTKIEYILKIARFTKKHWLVAEMFLCAHLANSVLYNGFNGISFKRLTENHSFHSEEQKNHDRGKMISYVWIVEVHVHYVHRYGGLQSVYQHLHYNRGR